MQRCVMRSIAATQSFRCMSGRLSLLLGTLHARLAPELRGDFYVATPARDMFLAMTCDPQEFVERLKKRIALDYRRMPYPISDELFVVTRDGVAGTLREAA